MKIDAFDYELPDEKIAKYPPEDRGTTKLLVVDRNSGGIMHRSYSDIIDYLNPNDLLLLNDTKVIKARLLGTKETGGRVELFLTERHNDYSNLKTHKVLYKGRLKVGDIVTVGTFRIVVDAISDGTATVTTDVDLYDICEEYGEVPIPPYLHRNAEEIDISRYQTVFAEYSGSVAAPTASLNMTEELLSAIKQKGVSIEELTLHVGRGTFTPVRVENIEDHIMHEEYYEIPESTIAAIQTTKSRGYSITAVGTTVTRAVEHASRKILDFRLEIVDTIREKQDGVSGEADIFIYPGYEFAIVDHLLTNFHAPRSTVLLLTAAFTTPELLKQAYQEALENDYHFLSYGDSMLIL